MKIGTTIQIQLSVKILHLCFTTYILHVAIGVKAIVGSIVCTYYNWIRDASKSLFHTIVHAVHSAFYHIYHDTWCSVYLP